MGTIGHVFVLMLENRSFDHMLGFSGIAGKDAATGQATQLRGLQGNESNVWQGKNFAVSPSATFTMTVGPGHEFPDVLEQLAGVGATYPSRGQYPPINDSGYAANYASAAAQANPQEAMNCFSPAQLPVLTALAKSFAVCDGWCCSLPGPTWPNRFFLLGGSSGGLDHSPTTAEMAEWEAVFGFRFENGSIFDEKLRWKIYAGGDLCMAHALKGIHFTNITPYSEFAGDVGDPNYPAQFTLIEPNYGHVASDYKGGTSQHPLDDVTSGEAFIKATYEAIRNSPIWNSSLLILTWDEHGGFYDHGMPAAATDPGDAPNSKLNQSGFTFEQYGPRVPAVIVSPLIPAGLIDHRTYDHTSVLATMESLFGLAALTKRDASASTLLSLTSLSSARGDAPTSLPEPAKAPAAAMAMDAAQMALPGPPATRPLESMYSDPNMPGFAYLAMRNDLDLSPPQQRASIIARFQGLRTRDDVRQYIEEVRPRIRAARTSKRS